MRSVKNNRFKKKENTKNDRNVLTIKKKKEWKVYSRLKVKMTFQKKETQL